MGNEPDMRKYLQTGLLFFACVVPISPAAMAADTASQNVVGKENLEKLLTTKSCKDCNLSGLTLNRLDLSDADLEGADLSSSKILLTNLARVNLRNANLRGVDLGGSDLSDADLRGADLRGTSLDSAYYQGAKFDGKFVTEKPYEDVGVPEVEKKVYVPDAKTPKAVPETKVVSITEGTDHKITPPQSPVAQEAKVSAVTEKPNIVSEKKTAPPPVSPAIAPYAKKVVPVQRAIVEPAEPKEGLKAAKIESGPELKNPPKKAAETADVAQSSVQALKEKNGNEGNQSKQVVVAKPEKMAQTASATKVMATAPEKEAGAGGNNAPDRSKAENLAKLIAKNGCFGCDLSGVDLSGKDLENADLEKANLTGSNLENADLAKANLKGALLVKADLRKANLKNADLYKADLTSADLTGAKVTGAMFDSAETASIIGLKEAVDDAAE